MVRSVFRRVAEGVRAGPLRGGERDDPRAADAGSGDARSGAVERWRAVRAPGPGRASRVPGGREGDVDRGSGNECPTVATSRSLLGSWRTRRFAPRGPRRTRVP